MSFVAFQFGSKVVSDLTVSELMFRDLFCQDGGWSLENALEEQMTMFDNMIEDEEDFEEPWQKNSLELVCVGTCKD